MRRQEFAVIGLGRFGVSLAKTLVDQGHTVLGIDQDAALVQRYAHELTQTVALDCTDEEALREIGVEDYSNVVVAIGTNFEASLMTCVALKSLGVSNVICKASTITHREVLLKVGVDRVVLPEHEGGERIARELANPHLVERIDLSPNTSITEIRVPTAMVGSTLEEVDLEKTYGLHVLAFVRRLKVSVPPLRQELLRDGDLLVVIGSREQTGRLIGDA